MFNKKTNCNNGEQNNRTQVDRFQEDNLLSELLYTVTDGQNILY